MLAYQPTWLEKQAANRKLSDPIPGTLAIVRPKVPSPDFPPWPVVILEPIEEIKSKSVRRLLLDAPPTEVLCGAV